MFEMHAEEFSSTLSEQVAEYLAIQDDPALKKLLSLVERDEKKRRGTSSSDPIDRAFGLPSIIESLNRSYHDHPTYVVEAVLPILTAHHHDEVLHRRYFPEAFSAQRANGTTETLHIPQDGRKLKVVLFDASHHAFPTYLHSQAGGAHDVTVGRLPNGYFSIQTRNKNTDLRCLTALLRIKELLLQQREVAEPLSRFADPGIVDETPEWYFDIHSNAIHNTTIHSPAATPSRINHDDLLNILSVGLQKIPWQKIGGG